MELDLEKKICLVSSADCEKVKFVHNLVSLFGAAVIKVADVKELTELDCSKLVILWDFNQFSHSINVIKNFSAARHIIFNTKRSEIDECFLLTAGYHGVLYKDDDAQLVVKGINWVAKGQLWFSRKSLSQLTVSLLKGEKLEQPDYCKETYALFQSLTLKEKQIIQCLIDGYKNKEIANDFAISEHTVKSHVYSIYKKIKVRNRVHAINLGRQFLPLLSA